MNKLAGWFAAVFLVVAFPTGTSASGKSVRLGYMPIAEELPKMVANDRGFFKNHDLDVELVRFESGPDMGTALLGGSIQVGMIGTPGLINAAIAGRPLVAVVDNGSNSASSVGHEYYTGLIVLEGSSIKTIGDLKGKKIAVNVLRANSETQTVMQVLKWNERNPNNTIDLSKDVQFVVLPFGSMPAALKRGVVDAASIIEPFMTQLAMSERVRIVSPVSDALENWPVSFGVVRRDFGRSNVDVLKAYKASWFDAVRFIKSNPDAARAIMQKYTGVSAEVAQRIVLPTWSEDVGTTFQKTEQVMDGMIAGGLIQKKPELQSIIVNDLSTLEK